MWSGKQQISQGSAAQKWSMYYINLSVGSYSFFIWDQIDLHF